MQPSFFFAMFEGDTKDYVPAADYSHSRLSSRTSIQMSRTSSSIIDLDDDTVKEAARAAGHGGAPGPGMKLSPDSVGSLPGRSSSRTSGDLPPPHPATQPQPQPQQQQQPGDVTKAVPPAAPATADAKSEKAEAKANCCGCTIS